MVHELQLELNPIEAGGCTDYIWSLTLLKQGVGVCWRMHILHLELNPIESGGRSLLEGTRTTSGA